ncbi:MAG TPA: DegT/DnrJ/EryC1/StrS family aminotransferase [Solirubrobacteraceae bacterium]|nr:DegT/DnrJ/EryC1/StrS family aminotransferase [Solirubrobacteraceae bacterium]
MSDGLIGVYPPLETSALRRRVRADAFPWSQPGLRLTHLGRGAVWLALEALGLGRGSRVAMPAYHCGSEVEAVHLRGCEIDFYRVDADLRVDEADMRRAAGESDALYLISNFGFPTPAAPNGARVLEDAAHALFSADPAGRPLGSRGAAAVFCPRKSLGVPDGGAVLVRDGAPREVARRPGAKAMLRSTASLALFRAAVARAGPVRGAAARAIGRASIGDQAAREGDLTDVVSGEWGLEPEDMENAAGRPSRLTAALVRRADPEAIRARRRANYETLLAELAELAPAAHRALPPGTCPLYFPVLAADRPAAIRGLLDRGVRPLEVWPVPHPRLDRERFAELEPVRAGLLALPVHQHLGPGHMRRVLEAAKAAL